MRLTRYVAGLETRVGDGNGMYPWSVLVEIGAGATRFASDRFQTSHGTEMTFNHTYFTAASGLQLGYWVRPGLAVVADGKLYWSRVMEEDTQPLISLTPTRNDPFGSVITLPVAIALRASI
jgi:hypothetical protein